MNLFSAFSTSTESDLPPFKTLVEGLDYLLPYLGPFSEELNDYEFYLNRRWMEVRDDAYFQEIILHVFKESGEYLHILDGDITQGKWEHDLDGVILQHGRSHELYQLVFLNEDFFILQKHGEHHSKGTGQRYLFFAREQLARNLEWPALLEVMYDYYKDSSSYKTIVVFVIIVVVLVALLSIL